MSMCLSVLELNLFRCNGPAKDGVLAVFDTTMPKAFSRQSSGGFPFEQSDQLYQVGIVLQLALSSHLLDVGFADAWCARNIGLYLNKSIECANATGLGHSSELKRLAEFLSPYGRWRNADVTATADTCPYSHERICRLVRDLLERVHEITGHPRPRQRGATVMERTEQHQLVAALQTLPHLTRAAFLLSARDDLSYPEIAWRCGISVDEVMVRIGDALLGIDRDMDGRTSLAGRSRRALLPCRDAWATARAREGDRRLMPWTSPNRKPGRRRALDWIAWAYELLFR